MRPLKWATINCFMKPESQKPLRGTDSTGHIGGSVVERNPFRREEKIKHYFPTGHGNNRKRSASLGRVASLNFTHIERGMPVGRVLKNRKLKKCRRKQLYEMIAFLPRFFKLIAFCPVGGEFKRGGIFGLVFNVKVFSVELPVLGFAAFFSVS